MWRNRENRLSGYDWKYRTGSCTGIVIEWTSTGLYTCVYIQVYRPVDVHSITMPVLLSGRPLVCILVYIYKYTDQWTSTQ